MLRDTASRPTIDGRRSLNASLRGTRRSRWIPLLLFVTSTLLATALAAEEERAPGFQAAKGRTTFRLYCASCHGTEAEGDGPIAKHLKVKPADLTRIAERYGEFPADRITQIIDGRTEVGAHGNREMPVWGEVFQSPTLGSGGEPSEGGQERARRKIAELVVYLSSIQQPEGAPTDE